MLKRVSWLLALLAVVAPPQLVADDGRVWLDRMSRAIRELSYEGTFVYLHGSQMETMRIIHRNGENGEEERLVSLNGAAREVLRDDTRVTCILPDSESIMIHQSRPRKPYPAALPEDLGELEDNYEFHVTGQDRIAGVSARVIVIKPRDAYRYGYRMWLDKDTNLLLKSDLTDTSGTPIEQMMFTRFRLRDDITSEELQPALSGEGYTRYDMALEEENETPPPVENRAWEVRRLPAGFMMTNHNRDFLPDGRDSVEHLVYSDGLATVSVYVEKPGPANEALRGVSSMGAVNAFGQQVAGHQVTVVGEVPRITVEMIARSTHPIR